MILIIDNYDSFTYNLVQYVGSLNYNVEVLKNDKLRKDLSKNGVLWVKKHLEINISLMPWSLTRLWVARLTDMLNFLMRQPDFGFLPMK